MFLTYLMLAVALCLSAIAAFYSIIGLTAIFAAAVVPVAIMGTILEIAKLTVTVWLHEYWSRCKRAMKIYLVPAVAILMVITSMGIFGFLSKAHLDQAVPTGDVAAQVSLLDEKIKTQKDNIEAARKALAQMDAAVDQTLSRSSDEKGADKAAALRRSQARERQNLQNDIARAQAEIAKLNEQRAPIAADLRKVEAEVGPIKYIAALIYGDNPDANLLEKAVRWVIIILVIVFDPLAIFMLLAATESYKWEKSGRPSEPEDHALSPITDKVKAWQDRLLQWRNKNANLDDDATVTKDLGGRDTRNDVGLESVDTVVEPTSVPKEHWGGQDLTAILEKKLPELNPEAPIEYQVVEDADDENESDAIKEAKRLWKHDNPNKTLKEQRQLLAAGRIDHLPWEDYLPAAQNQFGFGTELPAQGHKGQIWCLTNTLPTALYKHNGEKWINIDKHITDVYAYDNAYIDHLIAKVSSGEYDPELLTDAERSQIELKLKQDLS